MERVHLWFDADAKKEVRERRSDADRLRAFVEDVRDLMEEMLSGHPSWYHYKADLFHPKLLARARDAWGGADGVRLHFDLVLQELEGLDLERLRRHGLHGRQLQFKFSPIAHWWKRLRDHGGRRILERLLDVIDGAIFNSLFPTLGVGEAIGEYKEAFKAIIVQRGNVDRP